MVAQRSLTSRLVAGLAARRLGGDSDSDSEDEAAAAFGAGVPPSLKCAPRQDGLGKEALAQVIRRALGLE